MSRGFYDSDYAKRLANGGFSATQAQHNFKNKKERELDAHASYTMSDHGVMRLLVGGKGYLVNRHGHPTLEYDT